MGRTSDELIGKRLRDLLNLAGSIFYETHFAPLYDVLTGAARNLQDQAAAGQYASEHVQNGGLVALSCRRGLTDAQSEPFLATFRSGHPTCWREIARAILEDPASVKGAPTARFGQSLCAAADRIVQAVGDDVTALAWADREQRCVVSRGRGDIVVDKHLRQVRCFGTREATSRGETGTRKMDLEVVTGSAFDKLIPGANGIRVRIVRGAAVEF